MERPVVFIAHSFDLEDLGVVASFKRALQRRGYSITSGERPEARRVSEKIKERIDRSHIFVAILTRRQLIADGSRWTASPWVIEEKGYSLGQNPQRPMILLVEDGITIPDEIGGLEGDIEYIRFDRFLLDPARRKLGDILSARKHKKLTGGEKNVKFS